MMCDVFPTRWRLLPSGINVLLVSSAQRVERISHKTQDFHFYRFIKRAKAKAKYTVIGILFYTTNDKTSFTNASTLACSTISATNVNNSSAMWRRVIASFSGWSVPRRNTLFMIVGRALSTMLLIAVKFAFVPKIITFELAVLIKLPTAVKLS